MHAIIKGSAAITRTNPFISIPPVELHQILRDNVPTGAASGNSGKRIPKALPLYVMTRERDCAGHVNWVQL
jgi:hypothetical protein